jgi:hypothetical protein
MFGRNVVAAALEVKSKAMVSKSPAWREIADALQLGQDGLRRLRNSDKTGFDPAAERKAESVGDSTADEVERRDAINFVRKKLKGEKADAIVAALQSGAVAPEDAEEMVKMLLPGGNNARSRRKPR